MEARITSDSLGVQSLRESLSASLVRKTKLFLGCEDTLPHSAGLEVVAHFASSVQQPLCEACYGRAESGG
jgi:hypothetical protein